MLRSADFRRARAEGARVRTAHFILVVVARAEPGPLRLGLVVSRKVGNAVARNRVKRRVRELFRTTDDLLPPGVDLVVIAGPGSADTPLAAIRQEWSGVQQMLAAKARRALAQPAEGTHVGRR